MLRLLVIVAVLGLCRGDVYRIKYPAGDPCILVDIDADFKLTWTDMNGKEQTRPDFTLNGTAIDSGTCAKNTESPAVSLSWSDGGTFMFTFTNNNDTISYDWNMRYSPKSVFTNNNQTATVLHSGYLGTGSSSQAFSCQHVPVVNNIKNQTGMNKYQLTITIKVIKAQAFNVNGGKFNGDDKCPADIQSTSASPSSPSSPSSKPTNATIKTSPASTKPTNATIKTSPASTKPTNATIKTSPASTKPTNTTTKPTTATTKPTNVTTKPTTATTKPTNVTTKPTTATTKPTTATTKPTTVPTPAPTPVPAPNAHAKQTFEVYAEDKQCVLMQGEFLFTLMYPKNDSTNGSVDVGLQEIKKVTGDCNATGGSENKITVDFYDDWTMELTISKKSSSVMLAAVADSETKYYWSHLNLKYNYNTTLGGKKLFPDVLVNATAPTLNASLAAGTYEASTDGSYLCKSNENVDLMGGNKLQTWNLQYNAFGATNRTTFTDKNLSECSADSKTSSVVPIAVGAALAGLVVIVLIAYLIGRRRNRKGYESV